MVGDEVTDAAAVAHVACLQSHDLRVRSDSDGVGVSSQSVKGFKRCMITVDSAGAVLMAGAYARQFGPLNQQIACTCARFDCFCGFSAHVTMAGALRYQPLTGPIAVVALGGWLRPAGGPRAPYWLATTQKVLRIGFPPLCKPECTSSAEGLRIGSTDAAITPACRCHSGTLPLAALAKAAGVDVYWLSDSYARWARTVPAVPTPTRCPCALVQEVSTDSGLAHYVRDLWSIGSRLPGSDRAFAATCRACGQMWRYDRSSGIASKM